MCDPKLNFHDNRIILISVQRSEKLCQSQKKGQRAVSNFILGSAARIDTDVSIYVATRRFVNTKPVYRFN